MTRNDEILKAFTWILNCTDEQYERFVEEVRHNPSNVFCVYVFALVAIMELAED